MKKLLIVSLLLLSMVGLFAQIPPFLLEFNLMTENEMGYHAEGTVGLKVEEFHTVPMADENFEIFVGTRNYIYWNWYDTPDENSAGSNVAYVGAEAVTPGRLTVQMSNLPNWSTNAMVSAHFWFVDSDGNEIGPIDIAKPATGSVYQYPQIVAWGGPTGPTPVLQWATVVAPEDTAPDVALDTDLEWSYPAASDEVLAADGFEVWVNEEMVYDGPNTSYTHTLAYATDYTWYVKPYTLPEAKGLKSRVEPQRDYPEGTATEWTFTTTNEVVIGDPENPNDIVINITIPAGGTYTAPVEVPVTVGQEIAGIVIPSGLDYFSSNIGQASGIYTFVFNFGWSDIVVYYGDNPVDPADYTFASGILTIIIDFGAKGPTDLFAFDPNTLPVTLSSFTAVAHANEYVTLKWVTESESNLQGYNVYRAQTDNQAQAIRINPTIVAPHNQTQTQTYTYTDNEVESTTYYYWLEVSELANENSFHGPIVVTVEDDPVVPGITETTFRNFGPSPFTTSTSTSLRVKEGETATVTIYNLLGQVVRRESFNAGEHNFEFNGRDANNKKVANGIYFVRMTSPTQTKNFKIVKIK